MHPKNSKQYRVTCLQCHGSNEVLITEIGPHQFIANLDQDHRKTGTPIIISARYRRDMQWGWDCGVCGNDSRIAREEFSQIEQLVVNGGRSAIDKITKSLKTADEKKFRMEPA
jgi:hypothetical protein